MAWTKVFEGPGFVIGKDDEAKTAVPYPPVDHRDGHHNAGFVSLADRSELAESIHEAQRSPGLMALLKEVNRFSSKFLTIGCECGVFMRPPGSEPDRYIGSYVAICFREPALNTYYGIYELIRQTLARTGGGTEKQNIAFEITIIPLKHFFGHSGCFELHINIIGNGNSDDEAWGAFSFACQRLAEAFKALFDLPADDPLFARRPDPPDQSTV